MRNWKSLLPVCVSAGAIAWLIAHVQADQLARAAAELNWLALIPVTALLVLSLFMWDAVCLRHLFTTTSTRLAYRQALHARGTSYLIGVINYELGQGMLAFDLARTQRISIVSSLSRILVLAYHDLVVLFSLALIGSTISSHPVTNYLRLFSGLGLLTLVTVPGIGALLPDSVRHRFLRSRWTAGLKSWSLWRSCRLAILRVAYFSIFICYAAAAFRICHLQAGHDLVLSAIPMVLLADALPSVSGLGTRDATLQLILTPPRPEVLAAMSLFWSTGLIVGRFAIGMLCTWCPRLGKPARFVRGGGHR
jgi:hypothetical protein